ncbi:MAG: DUF3343 domain-containing protein [Clostridia bacterium]
MGFEYFLISFSSRSQNFEFASLMHSYGAFAVIINTPRQIMSSCGVSVKTNKEGLNFAQSILRRRKFESFNGAFKIIQNGPMISVFPINIS